MAGALRLRGSLGGVGVGVRSVWMACGPTVETVPDQRMKFAPRSGCTLNKARGMRALGKVPCGVAGLQPLAGSRTA